MARTDFSKLTTDDLLQIIPATENREWEYKAAEIFERANFGNFKAQKLPPIVSSFANSGGGQLILGKRDDAHDFANVPATEGRATMEDHLGLVISQCVTPHYKDFEVFRVPISNQPGESVLVVAFEDSQAAPHQSNFGPNYYWRLPGSVQPAPHFHLELLRSRVTRAALKIHSIEHNLQQAQYDEGNRQWYVNFNFFLHIENVSMQVATAWAIKIDSERYGWTSREAQRQLTNGACVSGNPAVLLPTQQTNMVLQIDARLPTLREWEYFDVTFTPISQNFVGEPVRLHFPDHIQKLIATRELTNQLAQMDIDVQALRQRGLIH